MNSLDRRQFLQTAALGAASAVACRTTSSNSAKGPFNILVLKSDEHNPLVSSIHQHPAAVTPHMARLARRGTVFENAYCPSPLCMPSRSAYLSGRRVHQIQTYNNCNVFQFDYPNYGSVLSSQGVHTVHVGKLDVYNQASTLGFSEMILAGDRKQPGDLNISRNPLTIREGAAERANGYGVKENPFQGDNRRIQSALDWLEKTAPALDGPWTLEVNISKPHFPHYVSEELWELYSKWGDLPRHGPKEESADHPYARDLRAHFETEQFTESQIRGLRRGYLGCVTYVDRQLGRLLDMLEKAALIKNTIIAYTTDHGEMLGKFGMWWKCSLYEDSVRVPLIVAGPGFEPGRQVKTPVDQHDLQAALFKAVAAERPSNWTGVPLQDIPVNDPQRVIFSEYHGHGTRASAYLVRKGNWKLIYCAAAPHQLFHLESDPEELENLVRKRPEIFRELEGDLRQICSPEDENRRAEDFILRQLKAIAAD
ncbi:sulfatase-like hydrolase/transferase [Acidobacteria bacterium AH-259-O06]|nr:sulfatase-like hydrolase/transferase [Acidobacteria bacterium AH-259-O06]